MSYYLPASIIEMLDEYNKAFKKEYGYDCFRCYSCVFPVLLKKLQNEDPTICNEHIIGEILTSINTDYLISADYRKGIRENSGLICGYDCIHYEENNEACPFSFWEIDKTKIQLFVPLINRILQEYTNQEKE